MAESMAARAASVAVAASSGLFQNRDATLFVTLGALTTTATRSLGIGTSASAPATFGAYDGAPAALRIDEGSPSTFRPHAGGGTDVQLQVPVSAGALASMTSGEHVFLTLYSVSTPVSGSVPTLTVDLGALG
jgi:hypothetical protein